MPLSTTVKMTPTEQATAAVALEPYFDEVRIAQLAGAVVCESAEEIRSFFTVASVDRFIESQEIAIAEHCPDEGCPGIMHDNATGDGTHCCSHCGLTDEEIERRACDPDPDSYIGRFWVESGMKSQYPEQFTGWQCNGYKHNDLPATIRSAFTFWHDNQIRSGTTLSDHFKQNMTLSGL